MFSCSIKYFPNYIEIFFKKSKCTKRNVLVSAAATHLCGGVHTWSPRCGQLRDPLVPSQVRVLIHSWRVLHNDVWRSDPPLLCRRSTVFRWTNIYVTAVPGRIDWCNLDIWPTVPPYHPPPPRIYAPLADITYRKYC